MRSLAALPAVNFCLLVSLAATILTGGGMIEKQQATLEQHEQTLQMHRQYGERLLAEVAALRASTATPVTDPADGIVSMLQEPLQASAPTADLADHGRSTSTSSQPSHP